MCYQHKLVVKEQNSFEYKFLLHSKMDFLLWGKKEYYIPFVAMTAGFSKILEIIVRILIKAWFISSTGSFRERWYCIDLWWHRLKKKYIYRLVTNVPTKKMPTLLSSAMRITVLWIPRTPLLLFRNSIKLDYITPSKT